MEIYAPYIVYSTATAFFGKVAYSYLYSEDNNKKKLEDNKLDNNKNLDEDDNKNLDQDNNNIMNEEYQVIDGEGNNLKQKSSLGVTFMDKSKQIRKICKEECGFGIPYNKTKKIRSRLMNLIKEYETIGHEEFVHNHIKKWKLNEINLENQ